MPSRYVYDGKVREHEKEEARSRDVQRIFSGEIAAAEVRDRNGFFSVLDPSRAKLVRRRVRIQIAE